MVGLGKERVRQGEVTEVVAERRSQRGQMLPVCHVAREASTREQVVHRVRHVRAVQPVVVRILEVATIDLREEGEKLRVGDSEGCAEVAGHVHHVTDEDQRCVGRKLRDLKNIEIPRRNIAQHRVKHIVVVALNLVQVIRQLSPHRLLARSCAPLTGGADHGHGLASTQLLTIFPHLRRLLFFLHRPRLLEQAARIYEGLLG
mmetsp:Transcript_46128/g.128490  ORF Transcript_46128/g.128490 Transcript_46128/m.128490 type:complete len:202 (-) Transcript_46128:632-1237(-)